MVKEDTCSKIRHFLAVSALSSVCKPRAFESAGPKLHIVTLGFYSVSKFVFADVNRFFCFVLIFEILQLEWKHQL